MLILKCLSGGSDKELLNFILEDLDFSLVSIHVVVAYFLFHFAELLVEQFDHLVSLGLLVLGRKSIVIKQLLDGVFELLQPLLRGNACVLALASNRFDYIFLLLNDLPEEILFKAFLVLFVDLRIVRKHSVVFPTNDCVFQQQRLCLISDEGLCFLQLRQSVDVFILHGFKRRFALGSLHEIVGLILQLHDVRLRVSSLLLRHI